MSSEAFVFSETVIGLMNGRTDLSVFRFYMTTFQLLRRKWKLYWNGK